MSKRLTIVTATVAVAVLLSPMAGAETALANYEPGPIDIHYCEVDENNRPLEKGCYAAGWGTDAYRLVRATAAHRKSQGKPYNTVEAILSVNGWTKAQLEATYIRGGRYIRLIPQKAETGILW